MRCEQIQSLLHDYVEGSLGTVMHQQVEAHLACCAECQRELRYVRGIWQGLRQMPEVAPPADLHARIMTHVRANTRLREPAPHVAFLRWFGAAAVAASLLLMGFLIVQSDGVQAAFGFGGMRKTVAESGQPLPAGIFVEYREANDGTRLPVLLARMNFESRAWLRYLPENAAPGASPVLLWHGTLQPGRTIEIPLQALLKATTGRVVTLYWNTETRSSVLYMPVGYPPAKVANLRLQAKLGDALRELASIYQTPIESDPECHEPLVVLDVRNATIEQALQQLLIGTGYRLEREGVLWRVKAK
ncbi:MAG: zf-HC2 domain-containing protein [Armatimonadota bacterium]|nr:zf-HC2 domain-containing protein [Armatimonadota bacterium]